MAETIKAVRAEILLGNIAIGVYRLPDGSYRLSGRNVTDAIEEPNNSLIRVMGVKSLKALPNADLERYKISPGKGGSPFLPVAIPDAVSYWLKSAIAGNQKAAAIVTACAIESIDRRADAVFDVQVTEAERNDRFARMLDAPLPGEPIFQDRFEEEVARLTGYHKNDIRNGKFYWKFVYSWLTPDERSHLEEINPVLPNGRRKYKIHECLAADIRDRLYPLQLKLLGKMEACYTMGELERMIMRKDGIDQPGLFDGLLN